MIKTINQKHNIIILKGEMLKPFQLVSATRKGYITIIS